MAISLRKAEDVVVHAPAQDMVVLVSPPGTGKSSAAVRAARRTGEHYLPVYAATMEAVDARGLPYPADAQGGKDTKWAAPSFLPLAKQDHGDRHYLVNFDDWFQSPPPVLRATVRSIYGDGADRRLGDFPIYPNVRFMGTGNREQDRAGVYRPETYVNDRITYIEIEPDCDEWVSGALNGFAPPEHDTNYPEMRSQINEAVARGVPDELVAFVKQSHQCYDFSADQRSFLSPRSIERLGRFMRAFEVAGINGETLHEVACGTIGEANAVKFMAFYKFRNELPDIQAVLRGEDVKLPAKSEVLYILVTTILRAAKKEHLPAMTKLLERLAKVETGNGMKVGVEVSAYFFNECARGTANKELRDLRATGMKWLSENGKYYL